MRTFVHPTIRTESVDAIWFELTRRCLDFLVVLLGVGFAFCCCAEVSFAAVPVAAGPRHVVTHAAGFGRLTPSDYLDGCDFHLTAVVTLVDQQRPLVVVQDGTAAVALHFPVAQVGVRPGQCISLKGTNCVPYVQRFPKYPFRPSRRELLPSFEVPRAEGEYYLSRVRAHVTPPRTGEYTFWIASDNSSELWLSTDDAPARSQKIASISRFEWVSPGEWSRYPSQRSLPISLQAGKRYYIEALHEQTTQDGHLAVAWRGPELELSVIEGIHLSPYHVGNERHPAHGVTRDVWTNFMAGTLSGVSGPHSFQSMLSVESVSVCDPGPERCDKPAADVLDQEKWDQARNFRWTTFEGLVTFVALERTNAWLSLRGHGREVQVCSPIPEPALFRRLENSRIRVEGVCEGIYDINDELQPGIVWVSDARAITVIGENNPKAPNRREPVQPAGPGDDTVAKQGFYTMRGVVTFNACVEGVNYLVVQEGESAKMVSGGEAAFFGGCLNVGDWIGLGGTLRSAREMAVLAPLTISELGRHAMPPPITLPLATSISPNLAGRWCEFTGVPQSMLSNSMLRVASPDGSLHVWIGGMSSNELAGWIDATLRVQGIVLPNATGAHRVLVPSRKFVDVRDLAPADPFDRPATMIEHLIDNPESPMLQHRLKIAGKVTYADDCLFVVQDGSGALRLRNPENFSGRVDDSVEAVGFPFMQGSRLVLTDVQWRAAAMAVPVQPVSMDLNASPSSRQDAALVEFTGTLLAQKTTDKRQILELLNQHRVFTATLSGRSEPLPAIEVGSRLRIVGICDVDWSGGGGRQKTGQGSASGALNLLMRSPGDVTVLNGPPWWTRTRVVVLTGVLALVIAVTLLRIQMLQRRFKREQAMQTAFSQHVLGKLEEERSRIAGNLHDSLGQSLLIIRNRALIALQSASDEQQFREHATHISEATCQAIEEVRQIAQGLHPSLLDRLGLTEAIRACINLASENSSVSFASRVDGIDGLFQKDAEIHLFRIVQEAVTNVVKHSGATEATVVIKKSESSIAVSVRDNGSGFDPSERAEARHDIAYGLVGIRNRTAILGGIFQIESRPGEGTRLTIEAPFKETTAAA